jgi:hypothetical protein
MVVGLTRARVVQGLWVFMGIGVLAAILGILAVVFHDKPEQHATGLRAFLLLVFLLLMPSAIWLILVAILCSVTLRVDGACVEQVLWNRYVLKRQPISALYRISSGGLSALVLHFRGGKKIALPGIHHDDQVRFVSYLQELRADLEFG